MEKPGEPAPASIMNVVMTSGSRFIEVQATAEHVRFDERQLAELIGLARAGIGQLEEAQKRAVAF